MVSTDLIHRLADSNEEVLELLQKWPPQIGEDGILYFNCQTIHDVHSLTGYVNVMIPTMAEVSEKVVCRWQEEAPYHPNKEISFDTAPLLEYRKRMAIHVLAYWLGQDSQKEKPIE